MNFRHGITPRKSDIIPIQTETKRYLTLRPRKERISLTFRKSITGPCTCLFQKHCPSHSQDKVDEMSDDIASKLEKLHVHEVYEKIAPHFSNTRYKPWPMIVEFLNSLPDGSLVADVGCGNGKYLGVNPNLNMIGTDRSFNLIGCARERSQ